MVYLSKFYRIFLWLTVPSHPTEKFIWKIAYKVGRLCRKEDYFSQSVCLIDRLLSTSYCLFSRKTPTSLPKYWFSCFSCWQSWWQQYIQMNLKVNLNLILWTFAVVEGRFCCSSFEMWCSTWFNHRHSVNLNLHTWTHHH